MPLHINHMNCKLSERIVLQIEGIFFWKQNVYHVINRQLHAQASILINLVLLTTSMTHFQDTISSVWCYSEIATSQNADVSWLTK